MSAGPPRADAGLPVLIYSVWAVHNAQAGGMQQGAYCAGGFRRAEHPLGGFERGRGKQQSKAGGHYRSAVMLLLQQAPSLRRLAVRLVLPSV